MHMPLLAACAAAFLIASAPSMTPPLLDAMDVADIFEPLTCAMAHSASCHMTRELDDPSRAIGQAKRSRPMLAVAVE